MPGGYGEVVRAGYEGATKPYKIEGGKVVSFVSQEPYSLTMYKLGDAYYGARNDEFGYANYEIIPNPQYVLNPLTALINQLSLELGLTEQQKAQVVPILTDEAKQLAALKKNTALGATQKVEQLKQIGGTIDAKISPLLNPEQQQKFQAIRDEARRRIIEGMASKALHTVESGVKQEF
jgi:hypothetical protein